jgi:hypothetical protein
MWLFWRQGGCKNPAHFVKDAHGVGTPWSHHVLGGLQHLEEARITRCEILGAMVKTAKFGAACGHAATSAQTFLKQADLVARLHERAGASHACHASADHGDMTRCGCCN